MFTKKYLLEDLPPSRPTLEAIAAGPTIQTADPTNASEVGWYLATGSADAFYKTVDGLFNISAGTYNGIPTMESATINAAGTEVAVVFSKAMTVALDNAEGWTLNNPTRAMTYASGDGTNTFTFTIVGPILAAEAPTVTYVQPGDGFQDSSDFELASITEAAVVNNSTEVFPAMVSATINAAGTAVEVVFTEAITIGDGGNGGWTLNDPTEAMTYVSGDTTDTFTFSVVGPILATDTPTITYIQPGDGFEDAGGFDLASITAETVVNDSTEAIPTMVSATIDATGTEVTVEFSEAITIGSGGNAGWTLNEPTEVMTYVSGDTTDTIIFSVVGPILASDVPTITYVQPSGGFEDSAGLELASVTAEAVTNNSTEAVPTMVSATVDVAGTEVTVVFSEAITIGTGGNGGWTLNDPTEVMTYATGDTTDTFTFSVTGPILASDTPTITYVQPGNGFEDSAGLDLVSITAETVTNNSTESV